MAQLYPSTASELQECADTLASFSRVPCGFAHEMRPEGRFCSPEKRRLQLACGHYHDGALLGIVNIMQRNGVIALREGGALAEQIDSTQRQIKDLDDLAMQQAMSEGTVGYAATSGQAEILQLRIGLVDRLLGALEKRGIVPGSDRQ
jgi:hypothetical protein